MEKNDTTMYEYKTRSRYSEVNSDGILSLPSLLDYFQDCSIFHSEDIGLGLEYLKENNMVWVLSSWQIDIKRYPKLGENVIVGTAPYDFKGFIGCRNFWMKTDNNELLACANSVWSLIDTKEGRPMKLTEDMIKGYILSPKMNMEYMERHVKFAGEQKIYPSMTVKSHNLDTNLHVNNGQYIRIGLDYISNEELLRIKRLRAEYKIQAKLNSVLYPKKYEYDNKIGISLQNENEKPYCNMEFSFS